MACWKDEDKQKKRRGMALEKNKKNICKLNQIDRNKRSSCSWCRSSCGGRRWCSRTGQTRCETGTLRCTGNSVTTIGDFWKVSATIFLTIHAQIFWNFGGYLFWKTFGFKLKLWWLLFGQLLELFFQLFITISGHSVLGIVESQWKDSYVISVEDVNGRKADIESDNANWKRRVFILWASFYSLSPFK